MIKPKEKTSKSFETSLCKIATKAGAKHIVIHTPWRVQNIKNNLGAVFTCSNLLSSPALKTLINKNEPSLKAHAPIDRAIIIFWILNKLLVYEMMDAVMTNTRYVALPVRS